MGIKEPNAYSNTDHPESEAIKIFLNKIDSRKIKDSINKRDKLPNTDGFIEIINDKRVPIARLELQIKGRSGLGKTFSEDSSMLSYSDIVSPFLFILVDLDTATVYWAHISSLLIPNEKVSITKSHRLSFDLTKLEQVDNGNYAQNWLDIARDYQERNLKYHDTIKELKNLQSIIAKKNNLPPETIIYFQQYTDKVNSLLENNFSFIKEILFTGTWKIGVAVLSSEKDFVFGLYTIPYGSVDLIIQEIDSKKWNKQNGYFAGSMMRKNYKKSDTLAKEFIIDYFKRILENNDLPLTSDRLIEEYLYTTTHSICLSLGLEEKQSYSIKDIEDRFYKYFYRWVCAASKIINLDSEIKSQIQFDVLYLYARTRLNEIGKQMKLDEELPLPSMYIVSQGINFSKFKHYLNIAKVKSVLEVKNRLTSIIPEVDSLINRNSIWKVFTVEQRKKIILDFFSASFSMIDSFCKYYSMPSEFYTESANVDKIIITYELARDEYSFPILTQILFLKYKSGNFPKNKFSIQEELIQSENIMEKFIYEEGVYNLLFSKPYGESFIFSKNGLFEFMKEYFKSKIDDYIKDES